MHETATAYWHLDSPGSGQTLKAGGDMVRGWLVPKPGCHYTDLRLTAGQFQFAGIHGFPRADLADYFRSAQPSLLAEFAIPVQLPPGRTRLTLEGCTSPGAWEPVGSFEAGIVADGSLPLVEKMPIRAYEAGAALLDLLRRLGPGDVPLGAAVSELLDATPRPHIVRLPHLPFHGHLDEPWCWSRTVFGRLTVLGCLFHETQPIKRVFATADLQAVHNLDFGRESPLYASHYSSFANARACSFDGIVDVPAQLPQPFALRVYAELPDGSWHLGSVVRVTARDHEFAKQPLAPCSPLTFWRTWRRLRREAEARGYTFESGPALWRQLAKAWFDYREQAPRRAPPRARPAPPRSTVATREIRHLHLVTHNLNHEGAPLFLVEYARHMKRETGCQLSVTSGQEGPLRREYEAIGATVQTVDPGPLLLSTSAGGLRRAIRNLAVSADLRAADLVVANTLSAWWGVHLARQASRPSLLYIHESTPPAAFFYGHMKPVTLPVVEATFRLAGCVSFLTAATQRHYASLSDGSNYRLNPGWINLTAIDEFRRTYDREPGRAALDVAPGRRLVVNIGTVCDRKAQHIFARAVDLLWRTAPELAVQADFRMVGGRDTAYDRSLLDFLSTLGRPNLRVVRETPEVYPYYAAADLFVCSSYEESFPRVVLEAMAFELPIISTGVHGVPEITRPGREAELVPPGDTAALAAALRRLLASPADGRKMALAARARVVAEFDARLLLPRHAALARTVAARQG